MPVTHAKNVTIADWSGVVTVANSTGGTTTDQASNLARPSDWVSNHVVNLSASEVAPIFSFANGLSSTTAAGGITVGIDDALFMEAFPPSSVGSFLSSLPAGTWFFEPFVIPYAMTKGQLGIYASAAANFLHGAVYSAASTGAVTVNQTINNVLAIYKQGTGASTTRLESYWSSDCSFLATWVRNISTANTSSGTISNGLTLSIPAQFDASGGVTYSQVTTAGTTAMTTSTMASTRADNLITTAGVYLSGGRFDLFGFSTTLPAGQWWLAHMVSSTSSSNGTSGGVNPAGTKIPVQSYNFLALTGGQPFKRLGLSTSDASWQQRPWYGSFATTSGTAPANVATSDMRNMTNPGMLYWNVQKTSY